jgi:hypothetical protein
LKQGRDAIGEQIAPFEAAVELLCTTARSSRRCAGGIPPTGSPLAHGGLDLASLKIDDTLVTWKTTATLSATVGTPSVLDSPLRFGISTALTGGGM